MVQRYAIAMILLSILSQGREICFSQTFSDKKEAVKSIVHRYYGEGKFNGSIIVADSDGVIYKEILGMRDFENKREFKAKTYTGLASLSKILTSTAVMKLVENNSISLADKLIEFFPCLPGFYEAVTIKHLLTHTSGIPDFHTAPVYDVHNTDIYNFVKRQKELEFEPGTKYKYCNTSFVLLAMIIENVSGMTYPEYLDEHIFSVCGMDNTIVGRVSGSRKFAKSYQASGEIDDRPNYYYGPGEIYSTAEDLYKFDRAYFSGKILSPALMDKIFSRNTLTDGSYTNYGLGWGVYKVGDEYLLGHTGANYGFRALYEHQKSSGITIIILNNIGDKTPLMEIRTSIVNSLQL